VQSAGQQLLPNLVIDTEERARRIAEKPSDDASFSTILLIHSKLSLLASPRANGIINTVRDGSEVGVIQPLFL